ncbi:uncharacterized protein LOC113838331 [Cricetulus griseus]|uniref:Uncharacterized protein LOC113838331 n=1 Tax=Cricetulus griseus TaxID=10029 RepID=A0A9J7GMQ9_CRIGR|nr:uncharacterized protein LOC113838331 [Cricetulus griseus]
MAETEVGQSVSEFPDTLSPSPIDTKQPVKQIGEESGGNTDRSSEVSPGGEENKRQSREDKEPRQKRPRQCSGGSFSRPHHRRARGHLEDKSRASPPPARDRGRHKPQSTPAKQHWARDSQARHSEPRVKDRRPHPRSLVRPIKRERSQDTRAAPSNTPKRTRQDSAEAGCSRELSLLSRVRAHMGALEVALEELQGPGGAFLPEPSVSTEPRVSQRAWLSWQLSHAGAALHWALHTVNTILANQARMPRYPWP